MKLQLLQINAQQKVEILSSNSDIKLHEEVMSGILNSVLQSVKDIEVSNFYEVSTYTITNRIRSHQCYLLHSEEVHQKITVKSWELYFLQCTHHSLFHFHHYLLRHG